MAYKTYITEAIVCGSDDVHTADRSLLLFTRDAGMLYASVKSIRREESKHRYALQECSHARVTLVRGKGGWRVTGAEPIKNFYTEATTREARAFLRNTVLLLRRVVHGETPHPEIFDDAIAAYREGGEHDPRALEQVFTLRMLHVLGYIAPAPEYAHLLEGEFPDGVACGSIGGSILDVCRKATERALIESHL